MAQIPTNFWFTCLWRFLATEKHRISQVWVEKQGKEPVLIRVICGKDSSVDPKTSFLPDSSGLYNFRNPCQSAVHYPALWTRISLVRY